VLTSAAEQSDQWISGKCYFDMDECKERCSEEREEKVALYKIFGLAARVREGVKALPEEMLEELTEHLRARSRELTPTAKGACNGRHSGGSQAAFLKRASSLRGPPRRNA
jgi:hypothetical protein